MASPSWRDAAKGEGGVDTEAMSTTAAELDIGQCNQLLSQWTLDQRVLWAVEQFGESAILLSSMQKTASVLMHTFYRLGLDNDIVFGDTGFHFHETLHTRDLFMRQYRLNIVTVYPELTPEQQENVHGRKLHLCIRRAAGVLSHA